MEDLKSRGFDNAGLYDPPGVGGTHVMYVLHHADKPSLYAGLPDNPHISFFVDAWKGFLKPLAVAGIAFTAVAGFLHWVVLGTKRSRRTKTSKRRRHSSKERRGSRNELPHRNPDPQHQGGAGQPLDHRDLLRAL